MVKDGIWSALHCSSFLPPWNCVLCYFESSRVIHSRSSLTSGSELRAIDMVILLPFSFVKTGNGG